MNLRKASLENITELRKICIGAYGLNFKNHWIENGYELYIEKEFSIERLTSDINSKNEDYYFIEYENSSVGFIKIKTKISSKIADCELIKIYILPTYKGKGFGKFALLSIINKMKALNKKTLLLDVIDTNLNAITFYKKLGFKKVGKITLNEPFFKDELRGMDVMVLDI